MKEDAKTDLLSKDEKKEENKLKNVTEFILLMCIISGVILMAIGFADENFISVTSGIGVFLFGLFSWALSNVIYEISITLKKINKKFERKDDDRAL